MFTNGRKLTGISDCTEVNPLIITIATIVHTVRDFPAVIILSIILGYYSTLESLLSPLFCLMALDKAFLHNLLLQKINLLFRLTRKPSRILKSPQN